MPRCEGVSTSGMFKDGYRRRRCLIPIDGFFEWRDIHGTGRNKQPYAMAMKSGQPFALAGIWETWRDPATDEDIRTFCVITCPANDMVAAIHDRCRSSCPPELMTMGPIDRKVGSPKNDTADILDPVDPTT